MNRALIDTNVVLDVLLDRQEHVERSAAVWEAVETGICKGSLAAHAITTIHYLIRKELGLARAVRTISKILKVFDVAVVDGAVLQKLCSCRCPTLRTRLRLLRRSLQVAISS